MRVTVSDVRRSRRVPVALLTTLALVLPAALTRACSNAQEQKAP